MLQGRADDVIPAVAGPPIDFAAPSSPSPSTKVRHQRHLRRVGTGSTGLTDLSSLPAPPAPAAPPAPSQTPATTEPAPDLESWRVVNKRGAKHVAACLTRSETVKFMVRGTVARRKGVLVLTTQRLLFVRDRGTGSASIDFHLASLSSIAVEEAPASSRIVIQCLGLLTEIYDVPHAEAQTLVDQTQQLLSYIRFPVVTLQPRRVTKRLGRTSTPAAPPAPTPPSAEGPATADARPTAQDPSSLLVAHLRELAQLHQAGMLDDYEFSLAKAKLLG